MIRLAKSIGILAAFFMSGTALAADSGWTISEADGQVSIMRDNKAIYGAEGAKLQIDDVVRTGKGGNAVLTRGDEFVIVSPEQQVRITKKKESGTAAQIFQSLGEMLSVIKQKTTPKPSVEQPVLAAVVKGYDHGSEEGGAEDFEKAANTMSSGD